MLIYWELTRACPLACRHCRAEAIQQRSPLELDTAEALALLDAIVAFGPPLPHVIFTGGDPLRRPDLLELVRGATARGIGSSLAPSASRDLTVALLRELRAAGTQAISLSLDGSTAQRHDGLRGIPGTFDETLRAAAAAGEAGLPLQINTLVTADTAPDLPDVYALVSRLGILRWSLFFLIPTGRGAALRGVSPGESERIIRWLLALEATAPFALKTTEALHRNRVTAERAARAGQDAATLAHTPGGRAFGVRDGNGIAFVAHDGAVYPSGFLPLAAGNVRLTPIAEIYRSSELFVALRDPARLRGKCGACPYNEICGGSRARAFAATGDPLGSDPLCPYVPPRRTDA